MDILPPHGAHRSAAEVIPWRIRAIGAGISLLLVGAAVGVLLSLGGHPADGGVTFAKTASRPPAPSHSTTVGASAPAVARPSPAAPSARPQPAMPTAAPVAHPALTVLNNSTIEHLAADWAARFRAAGWPIAAVGGIRGRYRYTTVYYGPGQLDAARALVRQFPAITVIDSRADAPELPGTGLTVVVTKDFS
ncbi:MAG: LytR C-terminal domain-containing protein [Pseudonocardiales bacterium]